MTAGLNAPRNRVPDLAKAILEDRDQVAAIYATRSIEQAARLVGCGAEAFRRALVYHGIEIHVAGQPLDREPSERTLRRRARMNPAARYLPVVLSVEIIRSAAWEAYRRLGECPPNCPHLAGCMDTGETCRLDAELAPMAGMRRIR